LIVVIGDSHDRTKYSLRDEGTASCVGHEQNLFLNLLRKPQHAHDLSHPCPGDPLQLRYISLAGDLPCFQECLPLDGLAEEIDDSGGLGFLAGLPGGATLPLGWAALVAPRADVTVFKCPLGPRAISTVCSR